LQKLQAGKGKLCYKEQNPDGTDLDRLVLKINEIDRECHLTAGGHRGRDATVEKVKAISSVISMSTSPLQLNLKVSQHFILKLKVKEIDL